jgi:hypothetical protein
MRERFLIPLGKLAMVIKIMRVPYCRGQTSDIRSGGRFVSEESLNLDVDKMFNKDRA